MTRCAATLTDDRGTRGCALDAGHYRLVPDQGPDHVGASWHVDNLTDLGWADGFRGADSAPGAVPDDPIVAVLAAADAAEPRVRRVDVEAPMCDARFETPVAADAKAAVREHDDGLRSEAELRAALATGQPVMPTWDDPVPRHAQPVESPAVRRAGFGWPWRRPDTQDDDKAVQ